MGSPDAGINPPIDKSYPIWRNLLWRNHSSNCTVVQDQYPDYVDFLPVQLFFTLLYLVIWLFAVLGNLCVLYVVSIKKVTLSSVCSVFICSLAVSDILMSMTSLPITAISIFTRDWVFPIPFCSIMIFQGGSIFVSSFTMTAIAVDRFMLARHPSLKIIDFQRAIFIVVFIWVLGYSCALPVGIFSQTLSYDTYCGLFCDEIWPDSDTNGVSKLRTVYGMLVLIIQFAMPVFCSSVCYWKIGRIIGIQVQRRSLHRIVLQESRNRLQCRKNRTNRMMITMVFGLVLAWLPMNLVNLWRDFNQDGEQRSSLYTLIFAFAHSIAMTSAVWNPVIYCFFNPQFKKAIKKTLERRRMSRLSQKLEILPNNSDNSKPRRTPIFKKFYDRNRSSKCTTLPLVTNSTDVEDPQNRTFGENGSISKIHSASNYSKCQDVFL